MSNNNRDKHCTKQIEIDDHTAIYIVLFKTVLKWELQYIFSHPKLK